MSPRVIQLPLSGRDRRYYLNQLKKAEHAHRDLVSKLEGARRLAEEKTRLAHAVACEEWTVRQFIGGPAEPSPLITDALSGGYDLLEVRCRRCGHESLVDVKLVIWPRERPVHTLKNELRYQSCKDQRRTARPDLVTLRMRGHPTSGITKASVSSLPAYISCPHPRIARDNCMDDCSRKSPRSRSSCDKFDAKYPRSKVGRPHLKRGGSDGRTKPPTLQARSPMDARIQPRRPERPLFPPAENALRPVNSRPSAMPGSSTQRQLR
jgi:hypothetical protein